jgi:hypothetical protein
MFEGEGKVEKRTIPSGMLEYKLVPGLLEQSVNNI